MTDIWEPMVGRIVTKLELSDDSTEWGSHSNFQYIRFTFNDGTTREYVTDGDCCSTTWINDLIGVSALLGHTILKAVEVEMPDPPPPDKYEVWADYGVKIETTGGYFDIVYRNESNGYYGGELRLPNDEPWRRDEPAAGWRTITEDYSA